MCSIGEDNIEDLENDKYFPEKSTLKPLSEQKCNKCKTSPPCLVLRGKESYCKECFLASTTHKFRSTLGKHKIIRPGDRVLLVHKGGQASTAMLHFVKSGLDLNTHKKLRFEAEVLFIENNTHLDVEQRLKLVADVRMECEKFGFKCHLKTLASLIEENGSTLPQTEDIDIVSKFLEKQPDKSHQADFMAINMNKMILREAKNLDCKFIFTPTLSTDIASQILTDFALGRGSQIPATTGFLDDRDVSVTVVRPMRTFDMKEVTLYNHCHHLEPVIFSLNTQKSNNSVQNLMQKFVSDLQINYPSTVSTILRTGEKLQSSTSGNKCDICQAPLPVSREELSSEEATEFSHLVSTQRPDYNLHPVERYNVVLEKFSHKNGLELCFSCKHFE